MNNLVYLVAAYAFAWLAIFAYLYGMARRQRRLELELEMLRRTLEGETHQRDAPTEHRA
jgi:CcmD family protein